jgi:hypothetical protein
VGLAGILPAEFQISRQDADWPDRQNVCVQTGPPVEMRQFNHAAGLYLSALLAKNLGLEQARSFPGWSSAAGYALLP